MPRFEVQTYTLCDGWVNTWSTWTSEDPEPRPETFETREAAEESLQDFLQEIREEIEDGMREPDEGYDESEFRVVEVADA